MSRFLLHLFMATLISIPSVFGEEKPAASNDVICCSKQAVFIVRPSLDGLKPWNRKWAWQASDSPGIPAEMRPKFVNVTECKPVGEYIVVTSSSSGVAVIRRTDKACRFFATAKNAHSACLLPHNRIAVAASFGGDEVVVFDLDDLDSREKPVAHLPLHGAHGVTWDSKRSRLWALGHTQLALVSIEETSDGVSLEVEQDWKLPTKGGHDLSPTADGQSLLVTTDSHVYRFNTSDGSFELDKHLGSLAKVKSADEHPHTRKVVYQQAGKSWWGTTIRFVGDDAAMEDASERFYKFRWDVPVEEPQDVPTEK